MSSGDDLIGRISRQISDGEPVDWERAEEKAANDEERALLRHLRAVEQISDSQPVPPGSVDGAEVQIFASGVAFSDGTIDRSLQEHRQPAWGAFKIESKIGQGGMGVVYKALDENLRRHVALKVLPPGVVRHQERRARFLREARAAAAVNHPSVATIYDVKDSDGVACIVMEFVEGRNLRQILRGGRLSLGEAVRHARSIASGLDRAHRAGVVHRDLKPENVIVDDEGQLKILDFGLAKLVEEREGASLSQLSGVPTESEQLTSAGAVLGTVAYMSPEQAKAHPVDARTDIFSLGTMLYEMATGARPFQGDSSLEILTSILREDPPPASSRNPEVSPELDAILARCLEKDRERRYASSAELVEDLEALGYTSGPGQSRRSSTSGGMIPGIGRLQGRMPVILGGTALAVAAVAASLWLGVRDIPKTAPAEIPPVAIPNPPAGHIMILPFTVRGGEKVQLLGEGLMDLLTAKLGDAGNITTVDERRLLQYMKREGVTGRDLARVRQAALHFNAGSFVLGDVLEAGDRISLTASLYPAVGPEDPTSRADAEGLLTEILDLTDRLAIGLLQGHPEVESGWSPQTWSQDLDALKGWLECEKAYRDVSTGAALDSPIVSVCQIAVDADPGFALAWWTLYKAAVWQFGGGPLGKQAIKRAWELRDQLPPREKSQVIAAHAWRFLDFEETERLLRSHIKAYPDDIEALEAMANFLKEQQARVRCRDLGESLPFFERAQELDPESWMARLNYATALYSMRRFDDLLVYEEDELRHRDGLPPDAPVSHLACPDRGDFNLRTRNVNWTAYIAFSRMDRALMLECMPVLERQSDLWLASFGSMVDKTAENSESHQLIADQLDSSSRPPDVRAYGRLQKGIGEAAVGRWDRARRHFHEAGMRRPAITLVVRALHAATALHELPREDLAELRDQVAAWDVSKVTPPPEGPPERGPFNSIVFGRPEGTLPHARRYILALLAIRLGDEASARRHLDGLEALEPVSGFPALGSELAASVRTEIAWARGDSRAALDHVDRTETFQDYGLHWNVSSTIARTHPRYRKGDILLALNRPVEALAAFECVDYMSHLLDGFYRPASLLRKARAYEALGNAGAARDHYSRFAAWFSDPDPSARPLLEEAQAAIRRLGG